MTGQVVAHDVAAVVDAGQRDEVILDPAVSAGALAAVAELLDAMPDPAVEVELQRQLGRERYAEGLIDGWNAALEYVHRIRQDDFSPIARRILGLAGGDRPDFAELEVRRWGPGGRERAADPRPGDYSSPTRLEAAS